MRRASSPPIKWAGYLCIAYLCLVGLSIVSYLIEPHEQFIILFILGLPTSLGMYLLPDGVLLHPWVQIPLIIVLGLIQYGVVGALIGHLGSKKIALAIDRS